MVSGGDGQEWEKSLGAQPVQHAISMLGIARHVAGTGPPLTVKELGDLVEQVASSRSRFLFIRATAWLSLLYCVLVDDNFALHLPVLMTGLRWMAPRVSSACCRSR